MKKILSITILLFFSTSFFAKTKERKVNKTIFTSGILQDIKYRGFQCSGDYILKNKYSIGLNFAHAFSKIEVPTYLQGKINHSDSVQYKVAKILDVMIGKYVRISENENSLLQVKAGVSYSNFQGKINFLPFNCNLIYDTEVTNALGLALNGVLHIHAQHKLGMYISTYANLNSERILISLGIGIRFGKMAK
jgi:hypothetical protein